MGDPGKVREQDTCGILLAINHIRLKIRFKQRVTRVPELGRDQVHRIFLHLVVRVRTLGGRTESCSPLLSTVLETWLTINMLIKKLYFILKAKEILQDEVKRSGIIRFMFSKA